MPVRTPYRPTGKPNDPDGARHSREVARAFMEVTKHINTVQAAAQTAQDGVDGINGSSEIITWDLDWSTQGSTGVLATGTVSLFGYDWDFTIDTGAPNTSVEVVGGTGLQVTNIAAGVLAFTSSSQDAAFFSLPLSTIYSHMGIDSRYEIAVDGYMSVQSGNVWVQGVQWGWSSPADSPQPSRMRCVKFWGNAGTNNWSTVFNTAQNSALPTSISDDMNVARVQWSGAWSVYAGTWGGTFDTTPLNYAMGDAVAATEENPLTVNNGTLVIAFPVNISSATGVDDVIVIERMRIRARLRL